MCKQLIAAVTANSINERAQPMFCATAAVTASRPLNFKTGTPMGKDLLKWFCLILGFVASPIVFVYTLIRGLWTIRRALFPVRMRVDRKMFWIVYGLLLMVGLLFFPIIQVVIEDISTKLVSPLQGMLGIAIACSLVMVAVGRLNDRNMSGWWLLLYYGVPAITIVTLEYPFDSLPDWEQQLASLLATVFIVWAIVALGCRRGTVGPNEYGPERSWGP